MISIRKFLTITLAGGVAVTALPAQADMVMTYQETASGFTDFHATPTAFASGGGTNIYGDVFHSKTPTISGSPSPGYGFYDYFYFSVPNSVAADSVTSTISLTSSSMIDNMEVILYNATGNPPPVEGVPPGSVVASSQLITVAPGETETIEALSAEITQPGTYVLQIRGTADGDVGGSYSGSLNVSPVPLPAALPLLLSGFGLLGGLFRNRRAS